ncbi:type 1 glutamine amidotransferase [Brevibacterium samyangense]|uniref:GMP synthase n=1 Tax=Brevibacterium samyangense TaxID=366888 RepID=A0ABN2TJU1_9MICO
MTALSTPSSVPSPATSEAPAEAPPVPVRILVVQHEDGTDIRRFGTWLEDAGAVLRIVRPDRGEEIPDSSTYDALVVLGGQANALEDEANPWFPEVRGLLARSADGEFPSFNICLGAQMLAAAAGGEVSRIEAPQVGAFDVAARTEATTDPVFSALPDGDPVPTVLFHQDHFTLPAGARHLMDGSAAPHQAFRIGEAWGTQFHPESDPALVAHWSALTPDLEDWADVTADAVEGQTAAVQQGMEDAFRPVAEAFVAHVRERLSA